MDKQLIERIALEKAGDYGLDDLPALVAFANRFLARIDAERVSEAVAVVEGVDGYTGFIKPLRKLNAGTKLFLSPTIPKGMALVPDEILDRFPEINPSNYDHDDACKLNSWGVELVLAAAQGERK